jgi:predicted nuclease with TOPRIM domain
MKSLWEIDAELQKATQELIENGGELTDELNEILTVNNNEFEEKAENYLWLIKNLENETDLRTTEINRLRAKNEAIMNTIDTLKSKLIPALLKRGKTKISDFNLSVTKSKSVGTCDVNLIPKRYLRISLKTKIGFNFYEAMINELGLKRDEFLIEPDKATLRKDLMAGQIIKGASLNEKEVLTIK